MPAPVQLRPFLHFAKLPTRALDATRRALEADEEFRGRVAKVASEDDVGRGGWLWLTRPPGWEEEFASLQRGLTEAGAAGMDRRAETDARRRLAGAEAAVRRAEAAAEAAAEESAGAVAALTEERRARRAATENAEGLAARVDLVTAERDRARADRDRIRTEANQAQRRASELKRALDALRARPPSSPAPSSPAPPAPPPTAFEPSATSPPLPTGADGGAERVRVAAAALLDAAAAAAGMATGLRAAAMALAPEDPSATPALGAAATDPSPRERRPRQARRVPVSLPPGVLDDSVEAAAHLMRVPGMTLLVDGYNASQTGWAELPIAEQRRRLTDALAELAARTGVDVSVVFDGADLPWPTTAPTTGQLVKVHFSPAGVEADDVILERVAALAPARPVLVASSDRRVRDGSAMMGSNVISSPQLLSAMRR